MFKPPSRLSDNQAVEASSTIEASRPKSVPSLSKLLPEEALSRQLQVPPLLMQQSRTAAQKEEQDQNSKRPHLISHPLPNDVLFGRGRPLQAHHGNLRFHRIINKFRDKYKNAPKDEKATITAAVLAEVSTADHPCLSTNDDPHDDKKATRQNDRDEFANYNEVESASTYAAAALSQEFSISSRRHNIDNEKRSKGGRFLKRTESGNYWIEVSTAEAMEKASHALRGLKRRSDLHVSRSSSDSASLATTTAAIGVTAISSSFASPSCKVYCGRSNKDSSSTAGRQDTSPGRPKKRNRFSSSQQQAISTTETTEDPTATTAVVAATLQTSLSAGSAIRNPLEALVGAPFPTTLPDTLASRSYLVPEQTASSSVQQQNLQSQLVRYLTIQQQQQLQQQEYQARMQQLRQDVHRQIVVEIMAQQLVQQEQEQLQAHQQQQLVREQAIQRQLLLQQYEQQQQESTVPIQNHHSQRQLSQELAPQTPSNSVIASFLRGSIASPLQRQQQQQQQQQQNLMFQQLLMATAAFDRQRDHIREEGKDDDVKPPAR